MTFLQKVHEVCGWGNFTKRRLNFLPLVTVCFSTYTARHMEGEWGFYRCGIAPSIYFAMQ
jgi:hypothetical protein